MPKLLDKHLLGKYVNIYAIYELAPISSVPRMIAQMMLGEMMPTVTMMMMMQQSNYIS